MGRKREFLTSSFLSEVVVFFFFGVWNCGDSGVELTLMAWREKESFQAIIISVFQLSSQRNYIQLFFFYSFVIVFVSEISGTIIHLLDWMEMRDSRVQCTCERDAASRMTIDVVVWICNFWTFKLLNREYVSIFTLKYLYDSFFLWFHWLIHSRQE